MAGVWHYNKSSAESKRAELRDRGEPRKFRRISLAGAVRVATHTTVELGRDLSAGGIPGAHDDALEQPILRALAWRNYHQ